GSFGPILDGIRVASQRTPASVDLTWSTGAHTVKTGVSFVGLPFSSRDASQTDGSFSFTDRVTGLPGVTNTGLGYASFLLGAVDGAGVTTQVDQRAFAGAWGLFVQDQWAIHPKLTVSYGLRWDLFLPMEEHQDKISSFDPALPNPAAGGRLGALSIYGQGPGRNGLQSVAERYYKAFAPRVGVTYAFTPQTVLRASYGISYLPYWQKFYGTQGPSQPTAGFSATRNVTTLDNGVTPAFTWDAGFPATFPELPLLDPTLQNGSTIMFIDRGDHRPPIVQNIGVEIGRELPFQMALRVGYVGTLAHRLPMSGMDLNALPLEQLGLGNLLLADIHSPDAREAGIPLPWEGFTGSVAQALRPFPHYLSIPVLGAQIGRTSYHALQLNLQKRFGAGLTFLAAYTWSKNLGNTNFRGFTSAGDNIGVQHPDFLEDEQTILSKDRTHLLNLSWTYALPFGRGARWLGEAEGWVQQLVGGWRVSGIQNYHSGAPITVGTRASNPGGIGAWATRMAGVPVVATRCGDYDPGGPGQDRYLNLEAFATPAPFTLGDTSTLPDVRQCGWLDETLLVEKTVALGRGVRFMVGTMATNVFNRHQWTSLNADINNPDQFGRFTGASSPRTIQFYSRLEF
ncbi:MAG: TonB-dependent receptor domain-containing protein, partial [Dehalococcoidia bacterium]